MAIAILVIIIIITVLAGQWSGPKPSDPTAATLPAWLMSLDRAIGKLRGFVRAWRASQPDPPALAAMADEAAKRHGLDPMLLRALVFHESRWQVDALSPKGAVGLTQLLPSTAWTECNLASDQLRQPRRNLDCGARYLAKQLRRFSTVRKALCAYNAGPAVIAREGGCPDYPETQRYVRDVTRRWKERSDAG